MRTRRRRSSPICTPWFPQNPSTGFQISKPFCCPKLPSEPLVKIRPSDIKLREHPVELCGRLGHDPLRIEAIVEVRRGVASPPSFSLLQTGVVSRFRKPISRTGEGVGYMRGSPPSRDRHTANRAWPRPLKAPGLPLTGGHGTLR